MVQAFKEEAEGTTSLSHSEKIDADGAPKKKKKKKKKKKAEPCDGDGAVLGDGNGNNKGDKPAPGLTALKAGPRR